MAAIGIDLGTSECCVAYYSNGHAHMITHEHGMRDVPSYVSFTDSECIVGLRARAAAAKNSARTAYHFKRFIGRTFDDELVQSNAQRFPFPVVSRDNAPALDIKYLDEGPFSFIELTAMMLSKLKESAEKKVQKIAGAVIAVPAHFTMLQRQATLDAAQLANLHVFGLVKDPIATLLGYATIKPKEEFTADNKFMVVFDLGGGKTEASILFTRNGHTCLLASASRPQCGGDDFDNNMVDYLLRDILIRYKMDCSRDAKVVAKVRYSWWKAKKILSDATTANIEIVALLSADIDYKVTVTRDCFERENRHMWKNINDVLEEAFDRCAIVSRNNVDYVIMVGASTNIPRVRQEVDSFFDRPGLLKFDINSGEAVALGAAVRAAMYNGQLNGRIFDNTKPSIEYDSLANDGFCAETEPSLDEMHLKTIGVSVPDPDWRLTITEGAECVGVLSLAAPNEFYKYGSDNRATVELRLNDTRSRCLVQVTDSQNEPIPHHLEMTPSLTLVEMDECMRRAVKFRQHADEKSKRVVMRNMLEERCHHYERELWKLKETHDTGESGKELQTLIEESRRSVLANPAVSIVLDMKSKIENLFEEVDSNKKEVVVSPPSSPHVLSEARSPWSKLEAAYKLACLECSQLKTEHVALQTAVNDAPVRSLTAMGYEECQEEHIKRHGNIALLLLQTAKVSEVLDLMCR